MFLKELSESGVIRPVIDRCDPLEQLAETHSSVETGRKKGNVIIAVGQGSKT
jgi:NADPH:quinone reductase-like Zn-dependent oxidoreductase